MTVGDKIRKYRLEQGYTQKELAIKAGLSESAVRNYELGNRTASQDQLEKIANALKISPFALADPNFDTYISVMHSLFALEDQYGLHAYRDESGVPQLMFKDKGHDSLNMIDQVGEWADMYQKYRNEEIIQISKNDIKEIMIKWIKQMTTSLKRHKPLLQNQKIP